MIKVLPVKLVEGLKVSLMCDKVSLSNLIGTFQERIRPKIFRKLSNKIKKRTARMFEIFSLLCSSPVTFICSFLLKSNNLLSAHTSS